MSINVRCPHCGRDSSAPQPGVYTCGHCGEAMTVAPPPTAVHSHSPAASAPQSRNIARIETKGEMIGPGCFVQGIGIVALFFFPIGTVAAIPLLIWGSRLAYRPICGNCKNRLADKSVRLCPVCHFTLVK